MATEVMAMVTAAINEETNPAIRQIDARVQDLREAAEGLVILDAQAYEDAAGLVKGIAAAEEFVRGLFDPICQAAHEAHAQATGTRGRFLKPLEALRKLVGGKMGAYDEEQELLRQAEQALLQAEADAEAAKAQEAQAAQLAAQGHTDAAEIVRATPALAPPVTVPKAVPQIGGISRRVTYKWEVSDPAKLPREYLVVDEKKVGGVVRAVGLQAMKTIPGIRVWEDRGIAVSRKG